MLSAFSHVDENSISPEDMVHQEDGGLMDQDEFLSFLDEVEGEFGIELHQPEQEAVASVEDLMDFLMGVIQERLTAEDDLV